MFTAKMYVNFVFVEGSKSVQVDFGTEKLLVVSYLGERLIVAKIFEMKLYNKTKN
jgi:hypothetical protein